MKVDKLIEKTTDTQESKKWKVVVGIVVGLIIGCVLFAGLYVITEPLVLNHHKTKDIVVLYDFYNEKVGLNETAVYVIGNSVIGTATYAPLVDEILISKGYDVKVYNCYIGQGGSPMTALQIDSIIESGAEMVIYGTSYNTFTAKSLIDEMVLFSKYKFNLSDDFRIYYSDEELDLLERKPFDFRGYLGRIIFPTNTRGDNFDTKEPIGLERRLALEAGKDADAINSSAMNYHPIITNESTREKEIFIHSVEKLIDAGIDVVIINMAIHPLYSDNVSETSRANYLEILHSTNATVIDMEWAYGDDHFWDGVHSTWNGTQEFSRDLADIIIQELS